MQHVWLPELEGRGGSFDQCSLLCTFAINLCDFVFYLWYIYTVCWLCYLGETVSSLEISGTVPRPPSSCVCTYTQLGESCTLSGT